jgi:fructose-bisphosphate aldolase class 1
MQGNAVAGKYAAELVANAKKIVAPGKGILAADESTATIGRRVSRGVERGGGERCSITSAS